ncbi:unnamed protein product [Acanthoscelides obtectus]|uniref:Uncharacterized protein n=1 Tax=Acanthoscelides obtectus TaxID=200917 RepID=A0A9P0KKZ8_ACAOB|nr:unnamed protein product [Acanthoscelides obtectus]CAK1641739.1 hypothetical protein AOBTE_LOCUS12600 [Acanthoscelides obtectus]
MEQHNSYPADYYEVCSSNFSNKKKTNWFCNRPLDPPQETSRRMAALKMVS